MIPARGPQTVFFRFGQNCYHKLLKIVKKCLKISNFQRRRHKSSYLLVRKINTQKSTEIKNRNFRPKSKLVNYSDIDWSAKYTLTLPYTSQRCSQVERKLLAAIKNITPDFHLNVAWSLIKIGKIITPRLKPFDDSKINCCYFGALYQIR